jgi:hypothetical protein
LNQRPLGYEPNELPDCSTPQLQREHTVSSRLCQEPSKERQGHAVEDCPLRRQLHDLEEENSLKRLVCKLEDDLSRTHQAKFLARDFFDIPEVTAQTLHLTD